jgi:hypothetical protein
MRHLSWLMKSLSEHIARKANAEAGFNAMTTQLPSAINFAEWSNPSANGAAQGSSGNGPGKEKLRVLCSQGIALG